MLAHVGSGPGLWVTLGLMVVAAGIAFTRRNTSWLITLAGAGIGFQVLHFAEHLLQAGYWIARPTEAPWLTPWAAAGRDGIASLTDGQPGTGNELLHLVGNGIFLAGLVAALIATAGWLGTEYRTPGRRRLRLAVWIQAAHVAEHVVLTVTWLSMGRAHGASTFFGVLEPGTAVAGGVRVWFHFALNLVATAVAVGAVTSIYQALQDNNKGGIRWAPTQVRQSLMTER